MRLKKLELKDYCGYKHISFDLNRDFSCLYGPNGCGKTTVLNVITTLCSSLDFKDQQRLDRAFFPYIRDGAASFCVTGLFEHEGKDYEVVLTEKGFQKNEILKEKWWWAGMTYFAKFDADTRVFCLTKEKWPEFQSSYEEIVGFKVEPDFYDDIDDSTKKLRGCYATGFYIYKPQGKIPFERASAGEKKVAKSLSQIVNLPKERLPHIVLIDNMEMHVYYKRHLIMFDVMKKIFTGMQIVATSHSTVIVEKYEPRSDLIDVEETLKGDSI